MSKQNYGIISSIATGLGGLAALLFGILNLQYSGGYILSTIYGVLLLLVMVGAIVMVTLFNTKLSDKKDLYGFPFAIMPIWLIEATSLLGIDYTRIWGVEGGTLTVILTFVIVITGSVGYGLIMRKKIVPGRVFSLIFLGIALIGSILSFNRIALSIIGNICRLGAIVLAIVVLFMTKGLTPLPALPEQETERVAYTTPAQSQNKPRPVFEEEPAAMQKAPEPAPAVQEPKQTMREKLIEAKQLYEDGLISEEEYAALKKKTIDNQ